MAFESSGLQKISKYTAPWWIHPCLVILLLILPVDILSLFVSSGNLYLLSEPNDYINLATGSLSVLSLTALLSGAYITARVALSTGRQFAPSPTRINKALSVLGLISILSFSILYAPVVLHPQLIRVFYENQAGASHTVRESLDHIPGVTSFIGLSLPFTSIYSMARSSFGVSGVSKSNRWMFRTIIFFSVARTFLSSERLALIEILVCYFVPRFAFERMKPLAKRFGPVGGIVFVFILFSVGSYFRDWPFYRDSGISFWSFTVTRFLGYIITSLNNGAGLVTIYSPFYFPAFTVDGLSRLLSNILGVNWNPDGVEIVDFLQRFANPGFNNPCGLFVPYMDFGIIGGTLIMLLAGMFTGWLFVRLRAGRMIGVVLYPTWYIGILDIFRVWHWGDAAFWPVILSSFFISRYLER